MNTGAFEHFKKKKPFHHYLDGSYSYGQAPSSGYELAYRPAKPKSIGFSLINFCSFSCCIFKF